MLNNNQNVRVRFAPSPTGSLHVGGVRTALFNWLFARHYNGKFIIRIEDTDIKRSTQEYVKIVLDTMLWLNLKWDEGPFFQMQRNDLYLKYISKLLKNKSAYYCYCTKEKISKNKLNAQKKKKPFKYICNCKELSLKQLDEKKKLNQNPVVRFIVPKVGTTVINDLIKGRIVFNNALFGDFIILRANGTPTYNLACVVDDYNMKISHILRGDDHLSNCPKQVFIYNALGWKIPYFAHISMILDNNGKRMSKRERTLSVLEYRREGYLQEALLNYIALLGWSTTDSQQIFTLNELQQKFSIQRCSLNPAIFDVKKLVWINKEKMHTKSVEEIYQLFIDWVKYVHLNHIVQNWDIATLKKIITLEHNKFNTLNDIMQVACLFFNYKLMYNDDKIKKILFSVNSELVLIESLKNFSEHEQYNFSAGTLELYARNLAVKYNLKTSQVFHPIRIAVAGKMSGPSLFHMMEILGKEEVVNRISFALNIINKSKEDFSNVKN